MVKLFFWKKEEKVEEPVENQGSDWGEKNNDFRERLSEAYGVEKKSLESFHMAKLFFELYATEPQKLIEKANGAPFIAFKYAPAGVVSGELNSYKIGELAERAKSSSFPNDVLNKIIENPSKYIGVVKDCFEMPEIQKQYM